MSQHELSVEGMACGGCEENVVDSVSELSGVESVAADHESGTVTVDGGDGDEIRTAIDDAGYEVVN